MTTKYGSAWGLALVFILSLSCSPALYAQNMSGDGTRTEEATIYENAPDANGGGYNSVCIGNLGTTGTTRRAFARYDLPDIPTGSTITRVQMSVDQVRVRGNGEGAPKSATLEVHRVTESWQEGSSSPQSAACGGGGMAAGIDWQGAPSVKGGASATGALNTLSGQNIIIDTDSGNANDGLIEDVQAWVDGAENNGWRFRVAEEDTADNARLIMPQNITISWTEIAEDIFQINAAISDAWFFPDTSGQGFFIIVWEDSKLVFLAWFTYDTERPPEDVMAILGEPGHRWLTALGPYDGDTAALDVFLSSGMIFDSAEPPVTTEQMEGATIEIVWTGCNEGVLKYDIPSLGLSGEIPIQRIVLDNVAACEAAQLQ